MFSAGDDIWLRTRSTSSPRSVGTRCRPSPPALLVVQLAEVSLGRQLDRPYDVGQRGRQLVGHGGDEVALASLFVAFSVFSVAFWACFRFRPHRARTEERPALVEAG